VIAGLRAAGWAIRARSTVRRELPSGLDAVRLPPVPRLPATAATAVRAALRLSGASCLERALVEQAWHQAHGASRDLVIGVTSPRDFRAHAWLDGDPPCHDEALEELLRRRPVAH